MPWTGERHGVRECREFGWWVKRNPAGPGYVPCPPDDSDAVPDLDRLRTEAVWSKKRQRYLRKEDLSGTRLVKHLFYEDLTQWAMNIGEMVEGLSQAADDLRAMEARGVVLAEESDPEAGLSVLVTTEPSVANAFDFELEEDVEDTEGDGPGVPDFDQYLRKKVLIPFFIWDDGEVRPFVGLCRGNGPVGNEEDWEDTIGVYTAEGKYFCVTIDARVRCTVPQFFLNDEPFYFPIVGFDTMGARVDPATGNLQ
jgi:hypothetical protein